jgi:hypothetical protein
MHESNVGKASSILVTFKSMNELTLERNLHFFCIKFGILYFSYNVFIYGQKFIKPSCIVFKFILNIIVFVIIASFSFCVLLLHILLVSPNFVNFHQYLILVCLLFSILLFLFLRKVLSM